MGLPLTTAETFPCLPLNNTGFPDSRSPISPLHAFLIAKAPRVTWANRLARPRILRLYCCHASIHSFSGLQEPGTVTTCQPEFGRNPGHRQAATFPSGPLNRQVRKYNYSLRALRGSYDDKWRRKAGCFYAHSLPSVPQRFRRGSLDGKGSCFGRIKALNIILFFFYWISLRENPLQVRSDGRFKEVTSGPGARASRRSSRNISWCAHTVSLCPYHPRNVVARRPQDLNVMPVEKGD